MPATRKNETLHGVTKDAQDFHLLQANSRVRSFFPVIKACVHTPGFELAMLISIGSPSLSSNSQRYRRWDPIRTAAKGVVE